jgi:hypothetical protein
MDEGDSTPPEADVAEADVAEADVASDAAPDIDVLAGWDPAGPPRVLDGSAPFPTDTVVALGATLVGAAAGIAIGGRHPLVRAKVGGILGLAAAIVARRMWRLPG